VWCSANRGRGNEYINCRARELGPYGHSTGLNVLIAITGEVSFNGQHTDRWVDVWTGCGTTITRFVQFISAILNDIGPGTPQRRRVSTMDNLTTHRYISPGL
jgi:hypothetical protein